VLTAGYLSFGAGLAVTGRICDIGQNVLQSSFGTGSSSSLSYFQIVVLIAFLDYLFNLIVVCNNNNAVIKNICGRFEDLILLFRIPMGTRKIFRHAPSEISPALM
jgi:hypothetical protein